jgi:DNA uptake protein ComE-like DNA-binding protein
MSLLPEPVKKWFGYTRKERRASSILLLIMLVLLLVRVGFPDSKMKVEEMSITESSFAMPSVSSDNFVPVVKTGYQDTTVRRKTKQLIELNSCDSASLEALPGIGPVLSARIIKYRTLLGGFVVAEQLREVYGLSAETFELIKNRITVNPSAIRKTPVNTAEFRDLWRVPYLKRYDILAIIKYRDFKGKISSMEELVTNNIIADSTARKVKPYIVF